MLKSPEAYANELRGVEGQDVALLSTKSGGLSRAFVKQLQLHFRCSG